jgi:hypothetical protein
MFDLIYYNQRGEVKAIEMLYNDKTGDFVCVPQENYFIKGFVINGIYLTPYQVQKHLTNDLSALENHFLTCRYGFFPELNKFSFRNENQEYIISYTDELYNLYFKKPVKK